MFNFQIQLRWSYQLSGILLRVKCKIQRVWILTVIVGKCTWTQPVCPSSTCNKSPNSDCQTRTVQSHEADAYSHNKITQKIRVASVCTPCCMLLGVVATSLKPIKLLATCKRTQQLPTMLRPFARGFMVNSSSVFQASFGNNFNHVDNSHNYFFIQSHSTVIANLKLWYKQGIFLFVLEMILGSPDTSASVF